MLRVRRSDGEQPLKPYPEPNRGFREDQEARFARPPGERWVLRIDDEPLVEEVDGWRWKPGFFAGPVMAELLGPAGTSRWVLDVSPDPAKLGRERFDAMLDELINAEPALVFGEVSATLATTHGDLELTGDLQGLVSLARLRAWGDKLVRAVRAVEHRPRQTLRRTREFVPAHRARTVDVAALNRFVRSPNVRRSGVGSSHPFAIELGAEVEVPLVESTVDNPVNRVVVELLQRVLGRIGATSVALRDVAERTQDLELRAARVARLPARLEMLSRLKAGLEERLRAWPWRLVSCRDSSAAGMNALSADPVYARIGQLVWAVLRQGIGVGASEERLWLSPTWEIFERWCFVRLGKQLQREWPLLSWTRCEQPFATAAWRGEGDDVLLGPVVLRLLLQPRFLAWDLSADREFRSLSRERAPDLVMTLETPSRRAWAVLDAKYRVRRSRVLEAMESAHIYRDSLRWAGEAPAVSFLLVPAVPETGWLSESSFQREHSVGVMVFEGELDGLVAERLRLADQQA